MQRIREDYPDIENAPMEKLEESIHSIYDGIESHRIQEPALLNALAYLDLLAAELMLRYRRKGIRGAGGIAV